MIERVLLILLLTASVFIKVPYADAITVDDYQPGISAKGIASSRHNLGGFGRVVRTGSTTEICIFCHTPHHKDSSATPLWNRGGQAAASFTAYGPTLSGSNITSVSGPSLACLSCHDGVTTFDNLVNTPGKGGVVPGGADRVWGFNMPIGSSYPGQDDIRLDGFHTGPTQICSMCHNSMTAISLEYISSMNIGTNLSNDHPVSVVYNDTLAGAGLRLKSTIISTIDLVSELSPSADPALLHNLSQNRWAVNGFISDTATVNDLLRGGSVECTSCHDPHFSNKSWDEADSSYVTPTGSMSGPMTYTPGWCVNWEDCSDGLFLRRVGGNSGSGVCRTCHDK